MTRDPDEFDRAFAALHEAATGRAHDAETSATFAEARAANSVDDPSLVPRYFVDGFAALAARAERRPEPVASDDRGYSWILGDVVKAIPGSAFVEAADKTDYLAVPSLGLALAVANRGYDETWAIVPWTVGEPASAPSTAVRYLDTMAPTSDQIREWARDPGLRIIEQDEDYVLASPDRLPLMIELASDPNGPKRGLLLSILDRIATLPRSDLVPTMTRAEQLARESGDAALRRWADDLRGALDYFAGTGPVSTSEARSIADVLLRGPRRAPTALEESKRGDWIQLRAGLADAAAATLDSLYVHAPTGALLWSWDPVDEATLARLTPGTLTPPRDTSGPVALGERGWQALK